MKAIWSVMSIVAVANLLALIAIAGWLAASDRLDLGRLRSIRAVLAPSRAEEAAQRAEAERLATQQADLASQKARVGTAPLTAAERLNVKLEQSEMDRQRADRARKEIDDLRRALFLERERLDREIEAFRQTRAAFEDERKRIAEADGDEQFQKSLITLEQLKPDKIRTTLQQLLDAGQVGQVIAYLDGMQDRTRTKVLDEFVKADARLAADLLERLRVRGVEPRGPLSARDDQPVQTP